MPKKNTLTVLVISLLIIIGAIAFVVWRKKNDDKSQAITIGAILPLSGNSAQYGKFVQEGFELALEEINKRGGVKGAPLKVVYEDDQALASMAANAMLKLAQVDKVPIVFGSWPSSSALAQAPIANQQRIPILVEAQSPKIREAGDYVFRIQPDSRSYLNILAPYACRNLSLKRFAILYVNNDYGVDQAAVFREKVRELGSEVIFEEGFNQGAQDFRTVLAKVKAASPDGIFVPAYAEAGIILKQANEQGIKAKFLGSAPMENPDIVTTAGRSAEGVIYVHHFDPDSDNPTIKQFQQAYLSKHGRYPEGYAALAYDAAFVIHHVLEKCGPSRECLKNELYKVQNFPGVAGPTSFDDHGDVIKPIVVRTIKDGQFVTIKLESN